MHLDVARPADFLDPRLALVVELIVLHIKQLALCERALVEGCDQMFNTCAEAVGRG